MKRDYGLIRELLRRLEEKPNSGHMKADDFKVLGYDTPQVAYHLNLMYQAGFINAEAIRSTTSPDRIIEVWPFDLTWQAHEFLAASRDEAVWRKVLRDLGGNLGERAVQRVVGPAYRRGQEKVGPPMRPSHWK